MALLEELISRGVTLSVNSDNRLVFDAPANVLSNDLLVRMLVAREELLAALTPRYSLPMYGIYCPWCFTGVHFIEHEAGLCCDNCGREAWRFDGDVIVRCDWVERIMVTPIKNRSQGIECPEKEARKIRRAKREMADRLLF